MKNEVQLSIIVPVYNTEKYLSCCLDSILCQTMSNFELICVDDGSTDESPKILAEYAKKDERISVLTKPNGGLVSARKAGVNAAKGKYIGFVDADDWIEPEMYEILYTAAVENGVDLVSSDYCQEGNYTAISRDAVEAGLYTGERMQDLLNGAILNLKTKDKGISGSLCTKMFRSDILKEVIVKIPNDITVSEDKVTMVSYILECNSVMIIHEAYYHYVIRGDSMLNGLNSNYLLNIHYVYQYFRSLYSHTRFTDTMRIQAELYVTQFLIKGINSYLGFANPNLLWIDPYWLDNIPYGSNLILYGAGKLGEKYFQHLKAKGSYHFVGFVDFEWERNRNAEYEIFSPEKLSDMNYDYIVITIKNQEFAKSVKDRLIKIGIPSEKILWFRQDEIFWRFAEADGLLK